MDHQDTFERLRSSLTGQELPTSIVADIGGWDALASAAATLVDDPLLNVVTSIMCRDLDPATPACITAANTLVDVVAATVDPLTFGSSVETMCNAPVFLGVAGSRLADACLSLAGPPAGHDSGDTSGKAVRAAEALEALARLALDGHGSRFRVLGLLADIKGPQSDRYARAVLRTVAAAYDHWESVDDVVPVIEVVADEGDVVGDVEWTAANIEVMRALRSNTADAALGHFSTARKRLSNIDTGRDDAVILDRVLGHLEQLVAAAAGNPEVMPVAMLAFNADALAALRDDVARFALTSAGLSHWAGNRKRVVVGSWVRLAEDLTWLSGQLDRDVFYEVATVVDRIASIYDAAHSYDVTTHRDGIGIVTEVIRPVVEGGFVQRATLMRHLRDHADALEQQAATAGDADTTRRLGGVRVLLSAARERLLSSSEPPGKVDQQAAVPYLLADIIDGDPELLQKLGSTLDNDELTRIATALATYQHISRTEPDLTVEAVIIGIIDKLQASSHFRRAVADATTRIVRVLTLYVASMTNAQKSAAPWLFEAPVPEATLHEHLLMWLWSHHFRQRANSEVQSVGGGRADIQFSFEGFTLVAELKVDTTHVPLRDKPKYIRQTAAYGNTDVKIGFLVVLRTPASGATNLDDLASNVTHTTIDGNGGAGDRHVVMFDIPGNRTSPSTA